MRKQIESIVKQYLRGEMLKTRHTLSLSQVEMARRLAISTRAYTNIEGGRSCCSLFTFLLFLDQCCLDRDAFLEGLKALLDSKKTDAA